VGEDPEYPSSPKLISVPGLVAVAILGVAVAALARLFGPGNVLREVLIEMIASFGSTVLVLAVFGLIFKSGLERLLRGAPGGEGLERSAERLKDVLERPGEQNLEARTSDHGAKIDHIGEDVRALVDQELPALRKELAELRELLANLEREHGD
jgi:hypothetical protein